MFLVEVSHASPETIDWKAAEVALRELDDEIAADLCGAFGETLWDAAPPKTVLARDLTTFREALEHDEPTLFVSECEQETTCKCERGTRYSTVGSDKFAHEMPLYEPLCRLVGSGILEAAGFR